MVEEKGAFGVLQGQQGLSEVVVHFFHSLCEREARHKRDVGEGESMPCDRASFVYSKV